MVKVKVTESHTVKALLLAISVAISATRCTKEDVRTATLSSHAVPVWLFHLLTLSYVNVNVKKFYSAQSCSKRPTVHYNSQQHEPIKVMQ